MSKASVVRSPPPVKPPPSHPQQQQQPEPEPHRQLKPSVPKRPLSRKRPLPPSPPPVRLRGEQQQRRHGQRLELERRHSESRLGCGGTMSSTRLRVGELRWATRQAFSVRPFTPFRLLPFMHRRVRFSRLTLPVIPRSSDLQRYQLDDRRLPRPRPRHVRLDGSGGSHRSHLAVNGYVPLPLASLPARSGASVCFRARTDGSSFSLSPPRVPRL